ncbi:TIGR02281 family clan AA aspartic protease [Maricurvus nonylphenolicus]|uniref:retropepsin-like aspartic protease family protein n=1 Tax=Maricurvus nonylphenolicus TaxID=1008307 RepID=UPI0036F2A46F
MSGQQSPHSDTQPFGKGMLILAWLVALGLLTLFFRNWEEQRNNPNQDPSSSVNNGIREVILEGNRRHHYVANGKINGQEVTFLLDTGATDVVIPAKLASKLKLQKGPSGYAQTANGIVEVFSTRLNTLDLGSIHLTNVRASINPAMKDQAILLGMSALKQVEFTQRNGQLILRQYD